jgi:hypothetical protein
MKKLKYIFLFLLSNIILSRIEAQQDTIRKIKVITASQLDSLRKLNAPAPVVEPTNSTKTVANSENQALIKEIQSLRQELNILKDSKRVVVVQTVDAPQNPMTRYTSVGLNMLTMISRLAPFGNGIPLSGPTTVMMRRYRDNRAFRMGLGLNASPDAKTPNASLRIGTERKKQLNSSFAFTRGVDFLLATGTFNTPGFVFTPTPDPFIPGATTTPGAIGAALTFGIEYTPNKFISIGTETLIFGGISTGDNNGFGLKIVPPIAIYLNANLY